MVCAADGRLRVYRVSQVLDACLADERFTRPPDFDLAAFWHSWCAAQEQDRPSYPVTLRVSPRLVPYLPLVFGESVREPLARADPPDAEGRITLTLSFEWLGDARDRILSLGGAVEVLEPAALRHSVADFAAQTMALYKT